MNRPLLILLAVMVLVTGVQGLTVDFQNPTDFSAQVECAAGGTCVLVQNTTGGNSYVHFPYNGYIISQTVSPMTYSAASFLQTQSVNGVKLYDSSKTEMWSYWGNMGAVSYTHLTLPTILLV